MDNGTYKLLYIYNVDDYYPIGCLTSNSISESAEVLEATTRGNSNGWTSIVPTAQSFSIGFSGVLEYTDRGGTIITYGTLKGLKRSRTKIQWRIVNSDGSGETDQGEGYLTSLSESAEMNSFVTFDGEIQGTGDPSTTTWTPTSYPDLDSMIPPYEAAQ